MEQGHGSDKEDFCNTEAGSHSKEVSAVLITATESRMKSLEQREALKELSVFLSLFSFSTLKNFTLIFFILCSSIVLLILTFSSSGVEFINNDDNNFTFLSVLPPTTCTVKVFYSKIPRQFTKFDSAPSVLRHATLRRPEPAGHIYSARMHISQATVSVLHLLQGPPAPGPQARVQQNNSE